MARTLYRIYLYTVWMILLLFATGATAAFLAVVLRTSGLDSNPQSLSQSEIVQPAAFAVIAWLIAATLGGFHYWLIRRDIAQDPAAGQGPVRALYLNLIEAIAALVAVITIGVAIASLGNTYSFASTPIAFGLSAAGLFALLEVERRRTQAPMRASSQMPMESPSAHSFSRFSLAGIGWAASNLGGRKLRKN